MTFPLFLKKTLAYMTSGGVRRLPVVYHVKLHLMNSSLPSRAHYFMKLSFSLNVKGGKRGRGPWAFLTVVVGLYWFVCTLWSQVTVPGTCLCWINWWCSLVSRLVTIWGYSLWLSNTDKCHGTEIYSLRVTNQLRTLRELMVRHAPV